MAVAIHAVFGAQRIALTPTTATTPVAIPAAYLAFEIEGAEIPASVLLDKRSVLLARNETKTRGHFLLDAFRSVGFHCLQIGDGRYFFATEDAKLKIAGILRLLEEVGRSGLSWGHQIFFADGSALRDRRVDYAWLLENGPKIAEAARQIASLPLRKARRRIKEQAPTGGRVLVAPTLAVIRRRGIRALEEDPRGSLNFQGNYYSPRVGVIARSERSFDTIGNRRAAQLVMAAVSLGNELLAGDMPADAREPLTAVAKELNECLQLYPLVHLVGAKQLPDGPAPEEIVDLRYATIFELHDVLRRELGWEAGTELRDDYAFVGYSDQIYQAFVASLIANAIGAKPVGPTLYSGLARPSFRSDRYDIYYDTTPPSPEFHNWRNDSARPSDMRPDLTIVDRQERRGLLLDAKYRLDGDRAPASGLAECQVYMHSFQQEAIAICYPGIGPRVQEIRSGVFRMLEVSLAPYADVSNFVTATVWPQLEVMMQPLRNVV